MINDQHIRKQIESIIQANKSSQEKIECIEHLIEEVKIAYFFDGVNQSSRDRLKYKNEMKKLIGGNVVSIKAKKVFST